MQSIHRQFGKMMSKGPGDNAKVSVLLQDFANADEVLTSIIEASKAWKDAWVSILTVQLNMMTEFEELYNPIVGATSDGYGHEPALTPQLQLDRTKNLKEAYSELKTDLLDEVSMVDLRIIRPASDAKEYIKPIKKTIKNRENKRLDYESYQDRLEKKRKQKHSEKEEAGLIKLEADVAKAADDFQFADAHLRETLPPIIASTFSLLPHLLAALIVTQNTLLAQYYTSLHNYCTDEGLPSPPPSVQNVIVQWENDFKGVQQVVESINTIARGKAVHAPMQSVDDPSGRKGPSLTGLNLRNGLAARRTGFQNSSSLSDNLSGKLSTAGSRIQSSSIVSSHYSRSHASNRLDEEPELGGDHSSPYSQNPHSPADPVRNYIPDSENQSNRNAISIQAGKKKPPPPPPPKRIQSTKEQWVTALYTFTGQEPGDLSFQEGDRIRVVKRTDNTDDWWDGELRGMKGRFPANYVEI